MRQTLRWLGIGFWSLLSLDILIGAVDWLARWDWLKSFMKAHPLFAEFVRTPFVYAVLLILGFGFLQAERKLKAPRIVGRITGLLGLPDTATTPMAMFFIEEKKEPGWNEHPMNWHWFAKLNFVNESEIPTTIDSITVRLKWKWQRKRVFAKCAEDFGQYVFARRDKDGWPRDDEIPNLLKNLDGTALTHGIGHDGWVHFAVPDMTRKDMVTAKLDFWIVDAMQGKHKLRGNDADIERRVTITKRSR